MNESTNKTPDESPGTAESQAESPIFDDEQDGGRSQQVRESDRRWWISLAVQPVLFLACAAAAIGGLGLAQRWGWISSGHGGGHSGEHEHASGSAEETLYICPMMCTPPQSEPGRCPVCEMELVQASSGGGETDTQSVQIAPAARRVANIQTVAVETAPMRRTIRSVGELAYDEGSLKSLSAYVDGRLDRLYADYTGAVVEQGDHLALIYSPTLYAGQIELLTTRNALKERRRSTLASVEKIQNDLYEGARQKLIELGMTEEQIVQLERDGKASSRLPLSAPISGTVIERLAVEGQYVKKGQTIYRLADLSTVWLMLKLFPEEAAAICYGQKVEAEVQSLPGQAFVGRVAFIDPNVDPKTRTVGVRVVIPNDDGRLRVGDYAKAAIEVPLSGNGARPAAVYDPELADKWISPRHPHIIRSAAGNCPICGVKLVPASRFGYTADATASPAESLVVPRDAVLMAGDASVVYVETDPGRFEIRPVVLGPNCGDKVAILRGVSAGERVAARGNFLIDSQMQLAGNPSLIDPVRAEGGAYEEPSAEVIAALAKLSAVDRREAEQQAICPVTEMPLGSMGTPKKVDVDGRTVFICCEGCRKSLLAQPAKYLSTLSGKTGDREPPSVAPNLPPIGVPEAVESQEGLPPIGVPQAIEAIENVDPQNPVLPAERISGEPREGVR